MKNTNLLVIISVFFLTFFAVPSYAWDHSVQLGYGYSHDPNNVHYNNSGFLLSGDIIPLRHTCWTYWSVGGALGQWHSNAPANNNVTTASVDLNLRLYPMRVQPVYSPYFLASLGPAYLSKQRLGTNTQGSHMAAQINLGLGTEIHCFDVNLRMVHYSNASLATPNDGFNILYLLSFGYLFS